jgi:K+-sensing histidine kinase KdpD
MRTVVRPFTDKQIELVETFADQAVIAIENVRLFDEIQDKSRQLAEASERKSQFLASMSHELRMRAHKLLQFSERNRVHEALQTDPTSSQATATSRHRFTRGLRWRSPLRRIRRQFDRLDD